ncbi:hypothetical protein VULLAG_LOCUS22963 [Vulpes lagopus]
MQNVFTLEDSTPAINASRG